MDRADILLHIENIKKQLSLGQASLMVGAGFSLNADRKNSATPLPPDWNKLSDAFIQELYGTFSEEYQKRMRQSKNVLQLAQEYDSTFLRSKLNILVRSLIRDTELFPNELYKKMLNLQWHDIFTTNYDTLLERAALQIVDRNYTTIYNCKDLALSESPRIIKLHGSLHSESTHLIISEEDYRTYPSEYAPFVNTVQQAIMENTLCLIGFSGTDPNFLNWAGWVRDHLEKSMSPIYLIGILDISDSEYRVMTEKRIIPVDLSKVYDTKDHKDVLSKFFDDLESPTPESWSVKFNPFHIKDKNSSATDLIKVTNMWQEEREKYPKWIVVPHQKRKNLVASIELSDNIAESCKNLPVLQDIQTIYEYNWRLEHGLMCILPQMISSYEYIVKKYNPYSLEDKFFAEQSNTKQISYTEDIKTKWLDLMFSIFRWSRENDDVSKLKQYHDLLKKIAEEKDNSIQDRLHYELALNALFKPDIKSLEEVLKSWRKYLHHPEWKIKFAALSAEIGNTDDAEKELHYALQEIRSAIPKGKIKEDFYWLSLEGIVLISLQMFEQNKGWLNKQSSKSFLAEYGQRLAYIAKDLCDPWNELEYFDLLLQAGNTTTNGKISRRNFDHTSTSFVTSSGWNKDFLDGYQCIRFFEITGLPLFCGSVNLRNKTLALAAKKLTQFMPIVSLSLINRIGKSNDMTMEYIFGQQQLYSMPINDTNELAQAYVKEATYLLEKHSAQLAAFETNFYSRMFKNLIETISRLATKVDSETLQKIFDFMLKCYNSSINRLFLSFGNFKELVRHTFESMTPDAIYANLKMLLNIKLPLLPIAQHSWISPFSKISWSGYKRNPNECDEELNNLINTWIDYLKVSDEDFFRREARLTLYSLDELGILTEENQNEISKVLMSKKNKYNLPELYNFYTWSILKIMRNYEKIDDVKKSLLAYYKNCTFEFYKISNGQISWSMSDYSFEDKCYSIVTNCSVLKEINDYSLKLLPDEVWCIFVNIQKSLINSKKILMEKINSSSQWDNSIKASVIKKMRALDRVLGEVIIPASKNNQRRKKELRNFLSNNRDLYAFPTARVALMIKKMVFDSTLTKEFVTAITFPDTDLLSNYEQAIYNAYYYAKRELIPAVPKEVTDLLVYSIGLKSDDSFRKSCKLLGAIFPYCNVGQKNTKYLLDYLKDLAAQTSFESEKIRFSMEDRYDYRFAVAYLAACIHKDFAQNGRDIPSELQIWFDICHSPKEFPSVRNIWNQVMNSK